jgi:hypothetical protein
MKEVIQPVGKGQFALSQGWFNRAQTEIYCTGTPHGGRAKGRFTRRFLGRGLAWRIGAYRINDNHEFLLRGTLRDPAVRDLALRGRIYDGPRDARSSARHPAIRPLVFAPVDDPALFSPGGEIKNNFLAAVQPGSAVPLGCRQDQPMPRHDFICAALAEHCVTAVRFQDQRWRLARHSFPRDLYCLAPVGPGKVGLGANREGGEKQPGHAWKEHSKSDLEGPGF